MRINTLHSALRSVFVRNVIGEKLLRAFRLTDFKRLGNTSSGNALAAVFNDPKCLSASLGWSLPEAWILPQSMRQTSLELHQK